MERFATQLLEQHPQVVAIFVQSKAQRKISKDATEFGHCILHTRIRFSESILHLTYKLPVINYRQRKSEEEKPMEINKNIEIQTRFRND
nr:unnamed protein product [Callosobruchus analis]